MRFILLMIAGCICLQACHSNRMSFKSVASLSKQSFSDTLTLTSPDTSQTINAAQIANTPHSSQYPVNKSTQTSTLAKPDTSKTILISPKTTSSPVDSTKLYVPRKAPVHPMAHTSFWTGISTQILLLLTSFGGVAIFGLAVVSALIAITSGIRGLRQIRKSEGYYRGATRAMIGLILGGTIILPIIGLVLLLIMGYGYVKA
ncbi:hypothetical protein QNI16_20565 [Cytophagaceae bacterium YF14B1]|uniref:DUF4190 domain-containing protein n=1 Tax=Xanthocytophaga flava TaxID=3048013 RepID=A0AAE3QP36_9BACT|nr:hypothetical protein [Xanthocytophaga flavus]MDJ1482907.1 hypothetical protein [Xanthocytophaga flavus]